MQGFNMGRYIPPDLEGTSTTFNQASGKGHALGRRAHKLQSHGVLVVRFECPFAIWCTNCDPEQIIGQGVRFNAEKKSVGKYHSTTIWSFRFKHTVCGQWIEVRTDPKNSEYAVHEGGRRRDYGPENHFWIDSLGQGNDIGLATLNSGVSEEEKQKLENDGGFGLLEKKIHDKNVFDSNRRRLDDLTELSQRQWRDPYLQSRKLRAEFRVGRRQRQRDEKTGNELKDRYGLGVDLVPEDQDDVERAKLVEFGSVEEMEQLHSRGLARPLFDATTTKSSGLLPREPSNKRAKIVSAQRLEEQKSNLKARLQENARGAADPFVQESKHWEKRSKRRKGEVEEGSRPHQTEPMSEKDPDKSETSTSNTVPILALGDYDSD